MSTPHNDIKSLLAQVGIVESPASELTPGITARTYESDYARLYIADLSADSSHDWSDVVRKVDRRVLQDMRSAELKNGGIVDAHVCFIVADNEDPTPWVQRNEHIVRQVSRKYWIKNSSIDGDLENRLTLLPISNVPVLETMGHTRLSANDRTWLDRLAEDGASKIFVEFISILEDRT